ncbi:MAG TPA: pyridoxamine 5'-phosphate oxidase family protein [Streptosporangiaceae bacterium]|nr:pyridoxamine 5'-phosphate oxidase family protein [Streptosporangiaceae bacterium]
MGNDAESAGTDVGRRIAERRSKAGLTVTQAAERAGMAPEYLAYLESSLTPNPSQAALTRLAAALNTTPGSLSGAGLNLPPGQRAAAVGALLDSLTPAECRQYLAGGGIGRFLFVEPDRGPVAIPVNFRMDRDDVVFRTSSGGTVSAGLHESRVSFDVDHLDDVLGEGWSVLVTGKARVITDPDDLAHAEALHIEPWAGGDKPVYVRLTASQVTGRRIRVAS